MYNVVVVVVVIVVVVIVGRPTSSTSTNLIHHIRLMFNIVMWRKTHLQRRTIKPAVSAVAAARSQFSATVIAGSVVTSYNSLCLQRGTIEPTMLAKPAARNELRATAIAMTQVFIVLVGGSFRHTTMMWRRTWFDHD